MEAGLSNEKGYADLVVQAEQAVAGVKDAELRRVAFERVLDQLMSDREGQPAKLTESPRRKGDRPSKGKNQSGRSRVKVGPQTYVSELIDDGFFKKQKTISEVRSELGNRGHHVAITSLSGPLQRLCQNKSLRRQKIEGPGGKKTFGYSNW